MRDRSFMLDVIGFNASTSVCGKGLQRKLGLVLIHDMPTRLLKPSIVTFGSGASVCELCVQWEMAIASAVSIVNIKRLSGEMSA